MVEGEGRVVALLIPYRSRFDVMWASSRLRNMISRSELTRSGSYSNDDLEFKAVGPGITSRLTRVCVKILKDKSSSRHGSVK